MRTTPTDDERAVLLPDDSGPARLIVCERSGRWAVGLRRLLADASAAIYETRHLDACFDALTESPASFVVFDIDVDLLGPLLHRVATIPLRFPLARWAAVAPRRVAQCEWLVREAGAVHFTCSPRQLEPLAQIARRHLAQAPARPAGLLEQVWAGLPWHGA